MPSTGSTGERKNGQLDKFEEVQDELLRTEQTYLERLLLITDHYGQVLQQQSPDLHEKVIGTRFSLLISLSKQFLSETMSGKMIQELLVSSYLPSQKDPYLEYCKGHAMAKATLDNTNSEKKFRNKLEDMARIECSGLDLETLLMEPIQRIVRYPLLLKQMIHYCDGGNGGVVAKGTMVRALQIAESNLVIINEALRQAEHEYLIRSIQDLPIELFESRLALDPLDVAKKKSGRCLKMLLMFSGALVLIEQVDSRKGAKSANVSYKLYKRCIGNLRNVELVIAKDKHTLPSISADFDLVMTAQKEDGKITSEIINLTTNHKDKLKRLTETMSRLKRQIQTEIKTIDESKRLLIEKSLDGMKHPVEKSQKSSEKEREQAKSREKPPLPPPRPLSKRAGIENTNMDATGPFNSPPVIKKPTQTFSSFTFTQEKSSLSRLQSQATIPHFISKKLPMIAMICGTVLIKATIPLPLSKAHQLRLALNRQLIELEGHVASTILSLNSLDETLFIYLVDNAGKVIEESIFPMHVLEYYEGRETESIEVLKQSQVRVVFQYKPVYK